MSRIDQLKARALYARSAATALLQVARDYRNPLRIATKLRVILRREGLRGIAVRVRDHTARFVGHDESYNAQSYPEWCRRFDSLGPDEVADARRHLATLDLPPVAIVHAFTPGAAADRNRIVAGWRASIHPAWQAVVVPAADLPAAELDALRAALAGDPQVSVVETADGLRAALAPFRYALSCFGGTIANPLTLYGLLEAATREGAAAAYADSDRIDAAGIRSEPDFRPRFSPEYLRGWNYMGECLLADLDVAGVRDAVSGLVRADVAAFDASVRTIAGGGRVAHVPFLLHHATGIPARSPVPPARTGARPSVEIIVPTRDKAALLRTCLDGLRGKTNYDRDKVTVTVVDNGSTEPRTLAYFREIEAAGTARVLPYRQPFNFAAINNYAAARSEADILVFLNNDTSVIDPDWLIKMVALCVEPDIGAVGAKLLYKDGTIQHGGCVIGAASGTVAHLHAAQNPAHVVDRTRELSAVTGACLAIRRSVFEGVGGFDPTLRVAWNDVELCLKVLSAGYRNVYVAEPLFFHFESKSRGYDDDQKKLGVFDREAIYTRTRYPGFFRDDPGYSPNLSLTALGQLAVPPRAGRPWRALPGRPKKILMLSIIHNIGYGVPLVIEQQARKLVELGHHVVIGGPEGRNEFRYEGCERVHLSTAKAAAAWAFANDVDLVVPHTPPFFAVADLVGPHVKVLFYDYGEPPPELFPEPVKSYLEGVDRQKRFSSPLAAAVGTISAAVRSQTVNPDAVVVNLGNSHLATWSDERAAARERFRAEHGWDGRFVILTVCRFARTERRYKGVEKVTEVMQLFPYLHGARDPEPVWVLAGAATEEDIVEMRALGFTVFPNVPDATLIELYGAADAYLSLSRWEGYNLGIGQALAMGLPTAASDIPAHREFPIPTSNSVLDLCEWLAGEVEAVRNGTATRRPVLFDWEPSVTRFAALVDDVLARPLAEVRPGGREPRTSPV